MTKKKKPKRGRPKIYRKPIVVHVRMEKATWQEFRQMAKMLGISANAAVVRSAIAGKAAISPNQVIE